MQSPVSTGRPNQPELQKIQVLFSIDFHESIRDKFKTFGFFHLRISHQKSELEIQYVIQKLYKTASYEPHK